MAETQFRFYKDAQLTQPLDIIELHFNTFYNDDCKRFKVYLGSPDTSEKLCSVDGQTIKVMYEDTNFSNEHYFDPSYGATYKLALSEEGLNNAQVNQPLDLGVTEIRGGIENAIEIWVERCEKQGTTGVFTDFQLRTTPVRVVPANEDCNAGGNSGGGGG